MTTEELYELAGRLETMAQFEAKRYLRETLMAAADELRDKADNKKAPAALSDESKSSRRSRVPAGM